jgi:hypothetical protein
MTTKIEQEPKENWDEWWESYQPKDSEALRLLGRSLFLKMFLRERTGAFQELFDPTWMALQSYVLESSKDGISILEVDPLPFIEIFRLSGEPTAQDIKIYTDDFNYYRRHMVSLPLKHSHRAVKTVREVAHREIRAWCDKHSLRVDWCYEHTAASLRRFFVEQLLNLNRLLAQGYQHYQQVSKQHTPQEAAGIFLSDYWDAFERLLRDRWPQVMQAWSNEADLLEHTAEEARAVPGPKGGNLEDIIEYYYRVSTGIEEPFPDLPERFKKNTVLEARKKGVNQFLLPRKVNVRTPEGALRPRSAVINEFSQDLTRCYKAAFDQIPECYLPRSLYNRFIRQGKESLSEVLSDFYTSAENYLKQRGFRKIETRSSFELHCKWSIWRLEHQGKRNPSYDKIAERYNDLLHKRAEEGEQIDESEYVTGKAVELGVKRFIDLIGLVAPRA